jgi:hypothetical protein
MSGTGTSGSLQLSVAASPTTVETASSLLSLMAALNGTATDYIQGSQIRTLAETLGSVTEMQGVAGQALALQALLYGALSLFNITPSTATPATGVVTFATSIPISGAPNAPQAVVIPSGTLVQTAGGVQFSTILQTVLASGTATIVTGIIANTPGAAGNVASGAIVGSPLTSIGYPLYVSNQIATTGGSDAGTQSTALALFTSKIASLGLSSPVAVANAAIGVVASGTSETVQFSSVYEPWIAAGSGAASGVAGFTVFVDNGTGGASPGLLAAVRLWLNGSVTTGNSGFRPAGIPYTVAAVTPVFASATVAGALFPGLLTTGSVVPAVTNGVTNYFNTLGIAPAAAYQPQIAAQAADAGLGAFQSLTVNLYYAGTSTPVPVVSGGVGTRVILTSLSVNITVGT